MLVLTGGVATTTLDDGLDAVADPSGLVADTVRRTKSASSAVYTV
ncbi:MAG: hypothetical protein ACXVVK_03670 [Solirubrobacteraceae bacterium]